MSDTSFGFLMLGSLAAVGFALLLGTLAAMARYRRTGQFPGMAPDAEVTRGHVVGLWVRIAIGAALSALGVYLLFDRGVL